MSFAVLCPDLRWTDDSFLICEERMKAILLRGLQRGLNGFIFAESLKQCLINSIHNRKACSNTKIIKKKSMICVQNIPGNPPQNIRSNK